MTSSRVIFGASVVLAAGIAGAGFFVAEGIAQSRDTKVVTVKGLVERDVRADSVNWPFTFVVSGNDLTDVHAKAAAAQEQLVAFLTEGGLSAADFSPAQWRVADLKANEYGSGADAGKDRFIITAGVTINTGKIDTVLKLTMRTGELVQRGVLLSSTSANFRFNGLNAIKPDMLAEATRNARAAADQFAKDSQTEVGGIMRANQGVISIQSKGSDMDDSSVPDKVVRVVTTVDYALKD